MSLITGMLNKTCDVYKPVLTDDGAGGETVTSYTLVNSGVDVLVSQTQTTFSNEEGGRVSTSKTIAYFEFADETQLNVNFVIKNLKNQAGVVDMDVVDGVSTIRAYKLTGNQDPNGEGDHLEFLAETYHGRTEGQP